MIYILLGIWFITVVGFFAYLLLRIVWLETRVAQMHNDIIRDKINVDTTH